MNKNKFMESYIENLQRITLKNFADTSDKDRYFALCDTIMELINQEWRNCKNRTRRSRKAYYFSAEFSGKTSRLFYGFSSNSKT